MKQDTAVKWIVTILIGFILFFVLGFINVLLGFKHGAGAMHTVLSNGAIFAICTTIFNSNIFKINRDNPKNNKYNILIASILCIFTAISYHPGLKNVTTSYYEQKLNDADYKNIIDATKPEHIRFDIADRDLLEIIAHTTSDKEVAFNKFWASSVSSKYYQAYTVSVHRGDTPIEENIKFSDFFLSLSQDCTKIFLEMGIWVNMQLPVCTNSAGYIFIMDKQIPMFFSSSNKDDGSQHIFINDIKISPNELIALMKKGASMEIHLDALNVAAAFSLQGFTASVGRIDRLCRSRR